ncbi:allose kinase, partial [Treponema socranskii]
MDTVIGIDIGGTNLRIGYVDEAGTIFGFEKKFIGAVVKEDIVSDLEQKIAAYIRQHDLQKSCRAVAIGVPSSVSKNKSFIYSTPNLPGLNNIDLGGILHERLRLPVFIDRDVNYLLNNDIREYKLDEAKEKNIIGIYVGTGIGNALYINGGFYTGKNGVAGELGHIPMLGSQAVCGCGNIGCSETVASGRYLEKMCKENFPEIDIKEIFVKRNAHPLVQDFLKTLAYVIATEINI